MIEISRWLAGNKLWISISQRTKELSFCTKYWVYNSSTPLIIVPVLHILTHHIQSASGNVTIPVGNNKFHALMLFYASWKQNYKFSVSWGYRKRPVAWIKWVNVDIHAQSQQKHKINLLNILKTASVLVIDVTEAYLKPIHYLWWSFFSKIAAFSH